MWHYSSPSVTNVLEVNKDSSQGSSLNYAKIKSDLVSANVHYKTRGALLQALRWVSQFDSWKLTENEDAVVLMSIIKTLTYPSYLHS